MRKTVRAIVVRDGNILLIKRNKFGKEGYTLPGGGVDEGETPEQAAIRELDEETSIEASINCKLYSHQDNEFGLVDYYLCDYIGGGEPVLRDDTTEAQETSEGKNTYQPMWVTMDSISTIELWPKELKNRVSTDMSKGWPENVRII